MRSCTGAGRASRDGIRPTKEPLRTVVTANLLGYEAGLRFEASEAATTRSRDDRRRTLPSSEPSQRTGAPVCAGRSTPKVPQGPPGRVDRRAHRGPDADRRREAMGRLSSRHPLAAPQGAHHRRLRGWYGQEFTRRDQRAPRSPTPAAMIGNTVVFKPHTDTLLASHFLMDILNEAGLPPGVINMVSGSAAKISEQVLAHRELAGIHFTGSTEVFQGMWRTVGQNVDQYRTYPRLVGETGGKDFVVAPESAHTAALRTALIRRAFEYQGQKCSAASRAYIPQSMWKQLRSEMADEVDAIPQRDVADFRNFMGAVIDGKAY